MLHDWHRAVVVVVVVAVVVVVVVDVDVVVPNADMMYGTIFTKQDATFTYIYIKICKC